MADFRRTSVTGRKVGGTRCWKRLAAKQSITFVGGGMANGPATVNGVPFPRDHEGFPGYGIGGDPGSGVPQLVTGGALTKFKPHVVLLMIGTNDNSYKIDPGNAPARLGALMDQILTTAPDALLVVAQLTARSDGLDPPTETFNAAIPGVVKSRADKGKRVIWVDMYSAFTANPKYRTEYLFDHVHPREGGYAKMADVGMPR